MVLGLILSASLPASVRVNVCPVSIPVASNHDIASCVADAAKKKKKKKKEKKKKKGRSIL